jgi:hypothetical protein
MFTVLANHSYGSHSQYNGKRFMQYLAPTIPVSIKKIGENLERVGSYKVPGAAFHMTFAVPLILRCYIFRNSS